jgi:hypothetical protein
MNYVLIIKSTSDPGTKVASKSEGSKGESDARSIADLEAKVCQGRIRCTLLIDSGMNT